jgi:FtsP/CotA-like multicopper oxidase with cupredoxin domain
MNGAYWPHVAPLMLTKGQRVEIELVNQSMMAHPIHLHGHAFQVVGLNGRPLQGAMRDTVLVPIMGRVCGSPSMRSIRAVGPSTVTTSITCRPA